MLNYKKIKENLIIKTRSQKEKKEKILPKIIKKIRKLKSKINETKLSKQKSY